MLESLFNPRAVAVIGASTKELHIGNRIVKNLLDFGFMGPIYPVNPKADEIQGIKAYGSIREVPGEVDVAHMVIPARFVPQAIEDCGSKGVKFAILNGGGFAEAGPEGAAIQEECLTRAKKHGMRVFGPNCQGIINTDPKVRAYCNFTFTRPEPGHISIVALSGGVAEVIHQAFSEAGIGTRMYASNGNACDVTIPEILEYLGGDDGTRVIVLYVEGLRDPKAFLEVAMKVAAKKPILAMKAGRTPQGAKAAASHTGGLAKEDIVTDLIFQKAGVLSFSDEGELCQAAMAFASQPTPRGNRVGMITNTGGPAVIATDVLAGAGLRMPPLSPEAKSILRERLHPAASVGNPIDVLATAGSEHFRIAMDTMMNEDQIDSLYINFVTPFFVDADSVAREMAEVNRTAGKPIVCNLMTDKRRWAETVRILRDGAVPCYCFPSAAARVLVALTEYAKTRSREAGQAARLAHLDKAKVAAILGEARRVRKQTLSAGEVYQILAAYGIEAADWRIADDADSARQAAAEIGFPVVVKADSRSIVHKSDVGGVATNLEDLDAVDCAVRRMEQSLSREDLRFLIQKHLPAGREIIVGAKAERGLGHLLMFGIGGIYVEILKDVTFRICPVTRMEAREMLSSIQATPLLDGTRGEKGIDRESVTDVIVRVSQLVTDFPEIEETDINPLLAYQDGAVVVDARMAVTGSHEEGRQT